MVKGKSKFKTLLAAFAALFLAFAFTGCGEYTPPENSGGTPATPSTPVVPDKPTPPSVTDDGFTVQLLCSRGDFNENRYKDVTKLQAQWTDVETGEVFRSYFDESGKAERADLDGDYKVTLVTLPTGYTYEPNNYTVTNELKEARIMLYSLTPISLSLEPYQGNGFEGVYYYTIDAIGAYRVVLHNENEKVFFCFRSKEEGVYTVESLVDVTADEVNPIIDVHNGSFPNYVNPKIAATQDDGGPSGDYTKNFKWEYHLSASEVGGGLTFRLYSTCRNDPSHAYGRNGLIVDFIIDREGSFKNQYDISEEIPEPSESYFANVRRAANLLTPNHGVYNHSSERIDNVVTIDGKKVRKADLTEAQKQAQLAKKIISASDIKLVEETLMGADGPLKDEEGKEIKVKFYWYCDEEGNLESRVYANLVNNPFLSFTNPNILSKCGWLAPDGKSSARNYYYFVQAYTGNLNADGCFPVDEQLKEFLGYYALCQRMDLFYDGKGEAESLGYQSNEASMWLFACGLYR